MQAVNTFKNWPKAASRFYQAHADWHNGEGAGGNSPQAGQQAGAQGPGKGVQFQSPFGMGLFGIGVKNMPIWGSPFGGGLFGIGVKHQLVWQSPFGGGLFGIGVRNMPRWKSPFGGGLFGIRS